MKSIPLFILFGFLLFGCNSKEKSISEKEEEPTSRILNQELKEILPELIAVQNQIYKNNSHQNLNISFLSTENYFYTYITELDCERFSSNYLFEEKINNYDVRFYVNSKSYKPERFFDLKKVNVIPGIEIPTMICDDFYFITAKFLIGKNQLKLESINTIYNNELEFYDKSDSLFLRKNKILVEEPLPPEEK